MRPAHPLQGDYDPAELDRLARSLRLRVVALHGSRAEGREEADSDIDLAVLADGAVDNPRRLRLMRRLSALFSSASADVSLLNGAQPIFLAVVAETGIPLWECREGEFLRFASLAQRMYADGEKWQQAQAAHLRAPREGPA